MSFTQFLSILRARWRSGLVVLLATVTLALVTSLFVLSEKYTAMAAVVVDLRSPDPVAGTVMANVATAGYMATQVDILQSDRVARRVVSNLKLGDNPTLRQQWFEKTEGKGDPAVWIAEFLQTNLLVKPSRESNVINVGYVSRDGQFSAALANAFVKAYIDTTIELRVDPAKINNMFFDERAKQVRVELESAQARLSAFQREKGIIANDERLDIETARLNELSTQLVALQAVSAESSSRNAQVSGGADRMSEVLNNPLVSGLKADLSRQEAKLEELGARLGDAHPQVVEIKASIAETRKRVEAETRRVGSSMGINANINKTREAELRAALDAQRSLLLKLKSQRDDVNVKQRDVENAQRAYDAVAARVTQTGLESQNQLTNVALLSPAEPPLKPSSPKILVNTVLAIFLGGLLGVAIALLRELLDRKVRSIEDVINALDLPVIGVMPRPLRRNLLGGHRRALPQRMLSGLPNARRA
jgi:succinoglycan biosynthesis transport protein ExoP